jgi:hypothetical protein
MPMITDVLNARADAGGSADALVRQAHERWVNDGGTHLGDRRWSLSTVVSPAMSVTS